MDKFVESWDSNIEKSKVPHFEGIDYRIKERPILFQTEMVKAILEGRKTQTRRTVKPQPETVNTSTPIPVGDFIDLMNALKKKGLTTIKSKTGGFAFPKCPYGQPGDLLWLKETFGIKEPIFPDQDWNTFLYKSNEYPDHFPPCKWKPSIHMPKSACRIWLMIEDIQVERVKDISESDAKAEGIMEFDSQNPGWKAKMYGLPSYKTFGINNRIAFEKLWTRINGQESWRSNPWVWVVKFRVLSTTGKPSDEVIEKNYLELTSSPSGEVGRGRKEASNV